MQAITGFSKLNIEEKIELIMKTVTLNDQQIRMLQAHENEKDPDRVIEKLSENYISNYSLPFSIAPNFSVNDKWYYVPMVTEESSVVAAAAYAAKFWSGQGGFRSEITGTIKSGQIYFSWKGNIDKLQAILPVLKDRKSVV